MIELRKLSLKVAERIGFHIFSSVSIRSHGQPQISTRYVLLKSSFDPRLGFQSLLRTTVSLCSLASGL